MTGLVPYGPSVLSHKLETGNRSVTRTDGTMSKIQYGDCLIESLEKGKLFAKTKVYRDSACPLLGVFGTEDSYKKPPFRQ